MRLIGIEAGGTKFVCVLGNENGEVEDRQKIPTETPELTLQSVIDFIAKHACHSPVDAIGIGCFGPVDLKVGSPTYGFITSTPKQIWRNCNIVGAVRAHFKGPIGFDTDVNAAALGELYWGRGQDCQTLIYLTVGTGIGGGLIFKNQLHHGVMHPEMGHLLIPHDYKQDPFAGVCPNHGDCLEGLASGTALKARWQVQSAMHLPPEHPAWQLESHYLAVALANYILCFSPDRIVLGGGVMGQQQLLPMIRHKTVALLNGYLQNTSIDHIEHTIVPAGLRQDSGSKGALALAKQAYLS